MSSQTKSISASRNGILLSISIPTFNRPKALRKTLFSVATQVYLIGEPEIEILISDNCSDDMTVKEVYAVKEDFPSLLINYYKNEINLGFDANCDLAVRRSQGIFVWTLSDDDFLEENAIKTVYYNLRNNKDVVFVFINYFIISNNTLSKSFCSVDKTIRLSGEDLISKTRCSFCFVSSCIYRKELWISQNTKKYYGSNWISLFLARDLLRLGDGLLIGERLLRQVGKDIRLSRKEKQNENNNSIEFYINAHLNFIKFAYSLNEVGFSKEVQDNALSVAWGDNLRQILYFKSTAKNYRWYEIKLIIKKMAIYFGKKPIFWLAHVPVLILPNIIVLLIFWPIRLLYKSFMRLSKLVA